MTRLITMPEIERYFTVEDCIASLDTMFTEMGEGRAITDSREDVLTPVADPPEGATVPTYHGLKSMGGSIPALGVGAVRINSDVINWPTRAGTTRREKIPAADGRYTGLVLLFSTNTGEPLAIFPDGLVQSLRVGGTSALGAKYLARDDASRLGLLGAGWQARAHLKAHAALQDLESVRVYSPTRESRESFAEEMHAEVDASVEAVESAEGAFEGSDIVQCATNSLSAVFSLDWLDAGTHVGVIRDQEVPEGFFEPGAFDALAQSWSPITCLEELGGQLREHPIPTKNVNNYVVEGDDPVPKFTGREVGGDPVTDWERIPGLGDVIVDDAVGRTSSEDVTAFYNRGMGIQFAAAGKALFDIAEERDLGQTIPTELLTQEYHP